MAYSEALADRIRVYMEQKNVYATEKKMMGGLTFMVDEKMCVGIVNDDLMVRVGPAFEVEALKKPGARPMDFTGRPMSGYLFVHPEGIDQEEDFAYFIDRALAFNPKAKSSKKKSKK